MASIAIPAFRPETLNDHIIRDTQKQQYTKVYIEKNTNKMKTGPVKLSGYDQAWGAGYRAAPDQVYYPLPRLAGQPALVQQYLAAHGVSASEIGMWMANAYSPATVNSNEVREWHSIVKNGAGQPSYQLLGSRSIADHFRRELAELETQPKKSIAKSKGLDYERLAALSKAIHSGHSATIVMAKSPSKTASGKTSLRGDGGSKDVRERLYRAKATSRPIDITKTVVTGTGALTKELTRNSIRLSQNPNSLFHFVFFNPTAGEKGAIPDGPIYFLRALEKAATEAQDVSVLEGLNLIKTKFGADYIAFVQNAVQVGRQQAAIPMAAAPALAPVQIQAPAITMPTMPVFQMPAIVAPAAGSARAASPISSRSPARSASPSRVMMPMPTPLPVVGSPSRVALPMPTPLPAVGSPGRSALATPSRRIRMPLPDPLPESQ